MSQTYDTVSGQSSQRPTARRSTGQPSTGQQPIGQQGAPPGQGSPSGQQTGGGQQPGGSQTAQRVTRQEPARGQVDDAPVGRRFRTRNYLPAEARETSIAVLNHCLADIVVLRSHLKAAHWNVKGQNFYQLHELFEDVAETLGEYEDEVAERATALGGEALGTTRLAGRASNIPPWTPDLYEAPALLEHVADHLAAFDAELYEAITTVSQADDLDTADLLNELSRAVSKALWFVEAHLQGESRPEQYGQGGQPVGVGGGQGGQQFGGGQGGQPSGGGQGGQQFAAAGGRSAVPELGYALSSEEHGPDALVDNAVRAERAGFGHAFVSDHFHPWIRQQGEAPFVWSTLGAIARETDDIEVGTGVTAPIQRIHPAIAAQAAASVAAMFDGRFVYGVGTGEALNEHVTGGRWPPFDERLEMLAEAVEITRELWSGENVTHRGEHYTVENAKLFTLPEEPPPICVSGTGPKSARAAADFADALVSTAPKGDLVDAYEDSGGEGPRYGQATVCYAESEQEARETAHEWWPNVAVGGELGQILPTPIHFEQAAEMVTEDDVAELVACGPDPDRHLELLQKYADAGFDHVYVHQVGPDQEGFVDFYESEIMPSFG